MPRFCLCSWHSPTRASIPADRRGPQLAGLVTERGPGRDVCRVTPPELPVPVFDLQVCAASVVPHDGEQNGLMGRVDEGVDEFFTKKVTKMDSK